jgi:ADP-heptose:LPS heptosyltransferase
MKVPEKEIQKIAVFRALQLGDMLCAVPALRALHHAYPAAEITLLGMPWAKSLEDRFPHYIHSFKHFPGYPGLPEQPVDPKAFTQFLGEVQEEKFDLVLQMQGNGFIVNPMVELFAGKYIAGFFLQNNYCPDKNLFVEYPSGIHEIERHLFLMNHLGIEAMGMQLEFPLYDKDFEECEQLHFSLLSKKYICVHPGSRGAWRQWPPEYFAALANYCSAQGYTIVLTGTKDEMEIVQRVAQHLNEKPVIAAGKTSVGAVGVLIKNAFALISNCTGVSHMAAAFETPSIVISMDGEPERWAPLNKSLHRTIDWTKQPTLDLALKELKDLFNTLPQRNHFGNETIAIASQHITNGL